MARSSGPRCPSHCEPFGPRQPAQPQHGQAWPVCGTLCSAGGQQHQTARGLKEGLPAPAGDAWLSIGTLRLTGTGSKGCRPGRGGMDPPWRGSGAYACWSWASGEPLLPAPCPANAVPLGFGVPSLLLASWHFRDWNLTVLTRRTSPKCEFLVLFLLHFRTQAETFPGRRYSPKHGERSESRDIDCLSL